MSNMAHFLRDLVSLFELQGVLLAVETGDELRKVRYGALWAIVLTALGLSCIPLGMAGLALLNRRKYATLDRAVASGSGGRRPDIRLYGDLFDCRQP